MLVHAFLQHQGPRIVEGFGLLREPSNIPIAIMVVLEMDRNVLRLHCTYMICNGHVLRTLGDVLEEEDHHGAPRTERSETEAINHFPNSFTILVEGNDFHLRMVLHDALQSLLPELLLELTCIQDFDPLLLENANNLQRSYGLEHKPSLANKLRHVPDNTA